MSGYRDNPQLTTDEAAAIDALLAKDPPAVCRPACRAPLAVEEVRDINGQLVGIHSWWNLAH